MVLSNQYQFWLLPARYSAVTQTVEGFRWRDKPLQNMTDQQVRSSPLPLSVEEAIKKDTKTTKESDPKVSLKNQKQGRENLNQTTSSAFKVSWHCQERKRYSIKHLSTLSLKTQPSCRHKWQKSWGDATSEISSLLLSSAGSPSSPSWQVSNGHHSEG